MTIAQVQLLTDKQIVELIRPLVLNISMGSTQHRYPQWIASVFVNPDSMWKFASQHSMGFGYESDGRPFFTMSRWRTHRTNANLGSFKPLFQSDELQIVRALNYLLKIDMKFVTHRSQTVFVFRPEVRPAVLAYIMAYWLRRGRFRDLV